MAALMQYASGYRPQRIGCGFAKMVSEWRRRMSSHSELMTMSDRTLQDIGLSRCDAKFEAGKSFWTA